jgi:hypothetical protein
MEQSVKVQLDKEETRSVKTGRGVRQGCCLSPILFNLYSEYLTKEALEGLGHFEIGGQVNRSCDFRLLLNVHDICALLGYYAESCGVYQLSFS